MKTKEDLIVYAKKLKAEYPILKDFGKLFDLEICTGDTLAIWNHPEYLERKEAYWAKNSNRKRKQDNQQA